MKVLDAQTTTGQSASVPSYTGNDLLTGGLVNIFITGLGAGDEIRVQARLPDNSGWSDVKGVTNPITADGMYVVEAGANLLSLHLTNASLAPVTAWIEPDGEPWRRSVTAMS